jgi:hypothetical protein
VYSPTATLRRANLPLRAGLRRPMIALNG